VRCGCDRAKGSRVRGGGGLNKGPGPKGEEWFMTATAVLVLREEVLRILRTDRESFLFDLLRSVERRWCDGKIPERAEE